MKSFQEKWASVLRGVYDYRIYDFGGSELSLLLAFVKSRIFGDRIISLPFLDYGGPVGSAKDVDKAIKDCIKMSEESGAGFIEIRSPAEDFRESLRKNGFIERTDYCTFTIDLTKPEEELWKSIEKRVKNDINKAKRSDFYIFEADRKSEVETFYRCYTRTMKDIGSPPQPIKFFYNVWDQLYPDNASFRVAVYKGKCVAAMIFYKYGNSVFFVYNASDKDYVKMRATDLLLWDSILAFKREGYKVFDFGRTRHESGVYNYKKGWGGKEIGMPYFYRFLKFELGQRQETAYEKYSDLWRRFMPKFIADRLGPWIIKQIG